MMSDLMWFAASLDVACIIEGEGLVSRMTPVVLIKASDFPSAMTAACERGESFEETYPNADGDMVRWAFERVATLDVVGAELAPGVEVFSSFGEATDSSVPFDVVFQPSEQQPGQTGIHSPDTDRP